MKKKLDKKLKKNMKKKSSLHLHQEKAYIVIPAYNEEHSIGGVVRGLQKAGYQNIVVVDDGSKDKTAAAAGMAHATVLCHPINRGQGAALKTGIDYALQDGAGIIVTFDADGQHQTKDIVSLIQPIIRKEVDVTLGSRFLEPAAGAATIPWFRKLVLKAGVLFTLAYSGIALTDTHNGFRAFSRAAAEQIQIRHDRMEHASEIIDEIKRRSISYREVPVSILYTPYSQQKGQSALNSVRIAIKLVMRKLMS